MSWKTQQSTTKKLYEQSLLTISEKEEKNRIPEF